MNQAMLQAARKQKQAEAKARRERRAVNALATVEKRKSAPLPLRAPLADMGIADLNRRRSAPPVVLSLPTVAELAAAAAVEERKREQTNFYTYDTMPLYSEYRRQRDYSGSSSSSSSSSSSQGAASTMGHAYVDAGVIASEIASLSQSKCEHCSSDAGVEVAGETPRAIGGGSLDFSCLSCGAIRHVRLSKQIGKQDEVTVRFISAATTEGMGKAQIDRLLTKMDIGAVNNKVYARVVEKVDAAAAIEVDQMCDEALQREMAATLLMEGEACKSKTGKIMITIISDGTWQKRYGRNSLAGFVGVYGLYTGECLYAGSKMARCATCSYYKQKGQAAKKHDCTRTWNEAPNRDGATSNMEKVITLEAVEAIYKKGAIVGTLVTDGDTKTLAHIKSHGPKEVAEEIEGSQDLGHLAKNLKKRLYELNASGSLKGLIPEAEQERLRKLFANAVHEHRNNNKDKPLEGQAEQLQKKLRVIAPHQFKFNEAGTGLYDHCPCGSWCKLKPSNTMIYDASHIPGGRKNFLDHQARAAVIKIFENYSSMELCARLLLDCSTNVAESTNSLLWLRYLHKTFLRPRLSGLAWNLTQLQKKNGAMGAGEMVMGRMGLSELGPAAKQSAGKMDARDMK